MTSQSKPTQHSGLCSDVGIFRLSTPPARHFSQSCQVGLFPSFMRIRSDPCLLLSSLPFPLSTPNSLSPILTLLSPSCLPLPLHLTSCNLLSLSHSLAHSFLTLQIPTFLSPSIPPSSTPYLSPSLPTSHHPFLPPSLPSYLSLSFHECGSLLRDVCGNSVVRRELGPHRIGVIIPYSHPVAIY